MYIYERVIVTKHLLHFSYIQNLLSPDFTLLFKYSTILSLFELVNQGSWFNLSYKMEVILLNKDK